MQNEFCIKNIEVSKNSSNLIAYKPINYYSLIVQQINLNNIIKKFVYSDLIDGIEYQNVNMIQRNNVDWKSSVNVKSKCECEIHIHISKFQVVILWKVTNLLVKLEHIWIVYV